jgi:cytochrome c-type protein NapC
LFGIPAGGLLAFIVGIGFTGGFFGALQYTSTDAFCISCHEMKKASEELSHSQHNANAFGLHAGCSGCHVPPTFLGALMRNITSSVEIWGHLTGELDTPKVWKDLKVNDSVECRSCHTIAAMAVVTQSTTGAKEAGISPATMHQSLAASYTCIDCHKGVAHALPKGQ